MKHAREKLKRRKETKNMLRRLSRKIWCGLVKSLLPCRMLQRHLVKRQIDVLRRQRAARAKKAAARQMHARLMAYPSYRCKCKIVKFLRSTPRMRSFVELAAAHYNAQIDMQRGPGLGYYVKPDLESKLDLAQDYFRRDRGGLVEWWCRFTEDGRKFFDASDKIKLDLQIPFHEVFAGKCLRDFGIGVELDGVDYRRHLLFPSLDVNGSPNAQLMAKVAAKAGVRAVADSRKTA